MKGREMVVVTVRLRHSSSTSTPLPSSSVPSSSSVPRRPARLRRHVVVRPSGSRRVVVPRRVGVVLRRCGSALAASTGSGVWWMRE